MSARFGFGKNWSGFLSVLDQERIDEARSSLRQMLACENLEGCRFLDIGSGSGLFSLAAHELGAEVISFDYDSDSVACTNSLRERYASDSTRWKVLQGSVLDRDFLSALGEFQIVYSWGVLHHTGDMYRALENVVSSVAPEGKLFIAIYNDQGWLSRFWTRVKRLYNHGGLLVRSLLLIVF